jgi:nucleobase:cation symporter-1, NCS1 family
MNIEHRSIEFIPENERYGTPKRLFTIWFSVNMQVTALLVGTLSVLEGLNLFWTFVALIAGAVIGSIFMAAHSSQGPHLGIPQMIQSRAQFGVLGAAFPLLVVVLSYVLFFAANSVIMRESIKAVCPVPDNAAIVIFGLVTLGIAFVGYELIHRVGYALSCLSGLLFAMTLFLALRGPLPQHVWSPTPGAFKWATFMLAVTQAASWSIGFGPLVADYSRYIPKTASTAQTFWYSYLGQAIGSLFVMLVGAVLAVKIPGIADSPGASIAGMFGRISPLAYLIVILGVLQMNVMTLYSAYMSVTTIGTGFRGIKQISRTTKFTTLAVVTIIASAIAIATQYNFNAYFSDILIAQVYVLVPWSSINLCDFYFVRYGRYSVRDIYDKTGIYGTYNLTTLAIFAVTLLVEIPFVELSFYRGVVARILDADIAWVVSLVVPGALYVFFMRRRVVLSPVESRELRSLVD